MSFSVRTWQPAFIARIAAGACRKRGRPTDNDALDIELLGVFNEVAVIVVYRDVLTRFRFRLPAVLLHEAGPNGGRGRAVAVAVERAVLVVGADIGDRDDLNVSRINTADKDAAFVARAENGDANRFIDDPVLEVIRTDTFTGSEIGARRLLQKFASNQRTSDCGEEVFLTDRFLFAR